MAQPQGPNREKPFVFVILLICYDLSPLGGLVIQTGQPQGSNASTNSTLLSVFFLCFAPLGRLLGGTAKPQRLQSKKKYFSSVRRCLCFCRSMCELFPSLGGSVGRTAQLQGPTSTIISNNSNQLDFSAIFDPRESTQAIQHSRRTQQ